MIYQSTDGDHHYPPQLPPLPLSGTVDDDNAALGHEFGLSDWRSDLKSSPFYYAPMFTGAALTGAMIGGFIGFYGSKKEKRPELWTIAGAIAGAFLMSGVADEISK